MSDLPENRAGLYVLGVLDRADMEAIRAEAAANPALAADIAFWERRLAPLARLLPDLPPPETLWPRIEARLAGAPAALPESGAPPGAPEPAAPSAQIYPLPPPRRPSPRATAPERLWRATALAAMALAAGLAAFIVLRPSPTPAPPRLAVVQPIRPGEGAWLVEIAAGGELTVRASGALTLAADHDYELWAMPAGATRPLALGLMPRTGAAVLKPGNVPAEKFQLLVSLEPKGGSPTGLPTGPVVYSGNVITP